MESPLFYYYVSDKDLHGNYILLRTKENSEKVEVSYGAKPGWISIPIINLKNKPSFIDL